MSSNNTKTNPPKITIGLPVYNGEKFLHKRLESILSQTYTNFELIISDNASTDSTSIICQDYSKRDSRIHYIRQEKNREASWNFNFVLKEARSEYFVWAAVDDIMEPTFLEKNIHALLTDKSLVGSISKVKYYTLSDSGEKNSVDLQFDSFISRLRNSLKPFVIYPLKGTYEHKVRFFLKNMVHIVFYAVYKTNELQKSIVEESFVANDFAIILNMLRYGNIEVIDEVLMYRYHGGLSTKGIISQSRRLNHGILGILFPFHPFTRWCLRNLDNKIFLQNIDYFIQLNLEGCFLFFIDLIRISTHFILQK